MGRPSLISYEEVAAVCADLDSRGLCTVENVHRQLGDRGSRTTVHRHYQAWRQQLRAAAAQPFNATFSEGLRAALVREIETATAAARSELDARIADLEEQVRSALSNLDAAEHANEALRDQAAADARDAQTKDEAARQAQAELQGRAEELEKRIRMLEESLAREVKTAEAARMEAAKAMIKLEVSEDSRKHLEAHNGELLADVKRLQGALGVAEQRAAVAEEKAQSKAEQLTHAQREAESTRKVASELQTTLHTTEKRAADAERELAVCASERKALQARITEGEGRIKTLGDEVADQKQQAAEVAAKLRETSERLEASEAASKRAEARQEDLNRQLGAAQQRVAQLEQALERGVAEKLRGERK
jgi:chromosome segregation ATPase